MADETTKTDVLEAPEASKEVPTMTKKEEAAAVAVAARAAATTRATAALMHSGGRTPYLGVKDHIFWSGVEEFTSEGELSEEPLFLCSEAELEESTVVPPESVIRLVVERGDVPYSFMHYPSCFGLTTDWEE
ncbi:hypothetical protein F0562_025825 [Nyssa sinensis]|uniref:Uncharacterized protein n=1 Tax=Nyssa sinensis TaxID=561372 RepID=A0A5J5B7D5_9ASTE|nr:hypothetical protein F0562_025825 [Nyssa sinensis]